MSIAPFLPGLPVPAAPDGGTPPDVSAGSGFGDTLAAALAGGLGVPAPQPSVQAPTQAPAADPPAADPQPSPVDAGLACADLGLAWVDLAVPRVDLGLARVDSAVPRVDVGVPQVTGEAVPSEASAPAAPASRRTTAAGGALVTRSLALPVPSGTEDGPGTAGLTPADESADSTHANANSTDGTAKSSHANPNSTVGVPLSGTMTAAGPAVSKAVVQQVFPEVTRIVSTVGTPGGPGNGTHRITLTLQPAQLGEVRVTLVVRDGSVHVRLAGGTGGVEGTDAAAVHRALASGAPELQRLLERSGADARVSVRDPFAPLLPPASGTGSVATSTPSGTPTGSQAGTQTGPDAHGRSETQARQEQSARGQSHDQPREQPRRHEAPRASYPVTPTPVTGRLDRTV